MKPFLFPFSYVSKSELNTCSRFFEGIKVFQFSKKTMPPEMHTLSDTNLVEFVMPDPPTRSAFEAALAETENWAQHHRLGAASYAKGYKDRIPFFNASSVSQIRQDIRKADQQAEMTDNEDNEIMTAYIFLHMAEAFDIQNQAIVQKLQQQASMEKTLYAELRGDAPIAPMDRSEDFNDPTQFMLEDRLKAWCRVWMAGGHSRDLFITTRQAVILMIQEHLLENEDFVPVATVPAMDSKSEAAKEQYRDLGSYCHKLARNDLAHIRQSGLLDIYTPLSDSSDGMHIYLLPQIMPRQLFGRFAGRVDALENGATHDTDVINTVIGLIKPQDV